MKNRVIQGLNACALVASAALAYAFMTGVYPVAKAEEDPNLEYDLYVLNIAGASAGSINLDPPNQNIGTSGTLAYEANEAVDLTANPAAGYVFYQWSGHASGSSATASVTMTENKTVYAQFGRTLTVSAQGSGSVSPASGPQPANQTIQLSATPNVGYVFSHWTGDLSGSVNPANLTMNGNKSVTAVFTQQDYTLTLIVGGPGPVYVDAVARGEGVHAFTVPAGGSKSLNASPDAGNVFFRWENGHTGTNPLASVVMNGNKTVKAVFGRPIATAVAPAGGGNVGVSGADTKTVGGTVYYAVGSQATVTGTPSSGWQFQNWTGTQSATANPHSFTISGANSITGNFWRPTSVTVAVSPVGKGSVSPGTGSYDLNSVLNLTATPIADWYFHQWTGDVSGSDNPASLTVNGAKSLTAEFKNIKDLAANLDGHGLILAHHYGSNPASNSSIVVDDDFNDQDLSDWSSGNLASAGDGSLEISPTSAAITLSKAHTYANTITFFEYSMADLTDPLNRAYAIHRFVDWNNYHCLRFKPGVVEVIERLNGSGLIKDAYTYSQTADTWYAVAVVTAPDRIDVWHGAQTGNMTLVCSATPAQALATNSFKFSVNQSPFRFDNLRIHEYNATNATTRVPPYPTYGESAAPILEALAAPRWYFREWGGDLSGDVAAQSLTFSNDRSVTAVFKPIYALQAAATGHGLLVAHHFDTDPSINSSVVLEDDFDDKDASDWSGGHLATADDRYVAISPTGTAISLTKTQTEANTINFLEYSMPDITNAQNRAYVIFRFVDWSNYQSIRLKPGLVEITENLNGQGSLIGSYAYTQAAGAWYSLAFVAAPDRIQVWHGSVDGDLTDACTAMTSNIAETQYFRLSVNQSEFRFDNLRIHGFNAENARIPPHETYGWGASPRIEALPAPRWKFTNWSGSSAGIESVLDIDMNEDKDVTAHFVERYREYDAAIDGQGIVLAHAEGTEVAENATVIKSDDLGVEAGSPWERIGEHLQSNPDPLESKQVIPFWTGGGGGSLRVANPAVSYLAQFRYRPMETDEIPVDVYIRYVDAADSTRLRMWSDRFEIVEVTASGESVVDDYPIPSDSETWYALQLAVDDRALRVWRATIDGDFNELLTYDLHSMSGNAYFGFESAGASSVSIQRFQLIGLDEENVGVAHSCLVEFGTTVTLHGVPAPGWDFSQWDGGLAGETATLSQAVDGDADFIGRFTRETYSIMVTVNEPGLGWTSLSSGLHEFDAAEQPTLQAIPKIGAQLSEVVDDTLAVLHAGPLPARVRLDNTMEAVTVTFAPFHDDAIEAAIRDELDLPTEEISLDDLLAITHLDLSGLRLDSLDGILALRNLSVLILDDNWLHDVAGIEALENLRELSLRFNGDLSDISGLEELSYLERVDLTGTSIADIGVLLQCIP